jgi:AcrR family transcriptional regulator
MSRTLSAEAHDKLTAAIDDVLYVQGLHEGTLDEICRRAEVSKPALYRHFGDRDQMLVDYLSRRRVRRMAAMQAAVDAAGTAPRRRVLALVDWVAQWITSAEFRGCGFHRALQQRPARADELLTITAAQKEWMEELLRRELGALVAKPGPLAAHLFLLIEGSMAAAAYRDPDGVARELRRTAKAVLDTAQAGRR